MVFNIKNYLIAAYAYFLYNVLLIVITYQSGCSLLEFKWVFFRKI